MTAVPIGNRAPEFRADAPAEQRPEVREERPAPLLTDQALACIACWCYSDGSPVHPTTGAIAARLDLAPNSPVRQELNLALAALRERRLVRYEHDLEQDGEIHWRLSKDGWTIIGEWLGAVTGFRRAPMPTGKPAWRR